MKKRLINIDIIRIFALTCVIAVHFFLNCGFYNEIVLGKRMYIMFIFRAFFLICVPMFITLTGYLKSQSQLSVQYYKGIVKILVIYVLCSIVYHVFIRFYLAVDINIMSFLENLFSYKGTEYSWYVEMYIGLFLLIPFLNLIMDHLKSKKEAQIWLLTLFFFNRFT